MTILTDHEASPLTLTMSHTWGPKIDKPVSVYQKCLNFCISAFGAGVSKRGAKCFLRSDPRHYLVTQFCEVAIEQNSDRVGVSMLLKPEAAISADIPLVNTRVARLEALNGGNSYYVSDDGIVHVFVPIGRVILNGEPSLDEGANKKKIEGMYNDFLQLLNTGQLPSDLLVQYELEQLIQEPTHQANGEVDFCV
jgi:hypothetical protein